MLACRSRLQGLVAEPAVHALTRRVCSAFSDDSPPETTELDRAMQQARAIHRATVEGIRCAILDGELEPLAAAGWITGAVETCIATMLEAVRAHVDERHGSTTGGAAVLGMGKLGSRELALGADLDLIFVCEAGADSQADRATEHFHRIAQLLFSALSWRPEAGHLYDVDMRLRPFGADGPLAVSYSSFRSYYRHDRWTWELQALTRARVIGDDSGFGRRLDQAVTEAIVHAPPAPVVFSDVARMRRTMAREQPAQSAWDLKRVSGGLVDLEFIVQALQLVNARATPDALCVNTGEALMSLERCGALDGSHADQLLDAWRLYSIVRQLQGAMGLKGMDLSQAPAELRAVTLASVGALNWSDLNGRLSKAQANVRRLFREIVASTAARTRAA